MIHLHNGDITAALAKRAGIAGEHVAFRETLVAGPVPYDLSSHEAIEARAQFLSTDYDQNLLRARNALLEQEQTILRAATHDEVVLWFEHDLFCFVNFVYLLQRLGGARVTAVWVEEPIGHKNEAEVPLLFESRAAVTPSMLAHARDVWRAYTSENPTSLNPLLEHDPYEFPFLRDALLLHASRFPSIRNGLGTVEHRLLDLIAGGVADFVALFARFEPKLRYGFGDTEVLRLLRVMAWCAVPLITITESTESAKKILLAITPAGNKVLTGELDATAANDPDTWLGGAHLTKETLWRWDERARRIIPNLSLVS
ncbi:MAG TPA: DUF1835 domain-containing protein [Thermoanaerobaculia bacterium]|nr:DUF1835 domain-containing protein [Thermoanaerobaculia bacterium]